jgi:hypothetical protein
LWIARPARIDAAFDTFRWPLLGIVFLPFATLLYVLLSIPGRGWSGGTGAGSGSPPCWISATGAPPPASATNSPAGAPQPHKNSDQDADLHQVAEQTRLVRCLSRASNPWANSPPMETVLYGPVQDQAALYGLLDRIQSLGLELVEIRQLPASAEVPAEPEHPPDR